MITKVLVTGGAGFVGQKVVEKLLDEGAEVLVLDRKNANISHNNLKFSNANLLDKEALLKDIKNFRPEAVLHLAAIASPVYGNVAELYDVNVHGSENLLDVLRDTCSGSTRVVLTSTAGVYGNSDKDLIDENTVYNPQNHYSFSKMIMEYISKMYRDELSIKIIRPFNMIGVGQNENFLVPKLVKAYVNKQEILKVGNMNTYRDFVDIDFASKIFVKSLLCENMEDDVLNICAGKGTCGQDILNMLTEITSYSPKIEVNPEFLRRNEIMRLVGNPKKCNLFIGTENKTKSVHEILTEMVKHAVTAA